MLALNTLLRLFALPSTRLNLLHRLHPGMTRLAASVDPVRARRASASGVTAVNSYPADVFVRTGLFPRPEPGRDASNCDRPYRDCDHRQNQLMNRHWLNRN